jgi:hypothetical protein
VSVHSCGINDETSIAGFETPSEETAAARLEPSAFRGLNARFSAPEGFASPALTDAAGASKTTMSPRLIRRVATTLRSPARPLTAHASHPGPKSSDARCEDALASPPSARSVSSEPLEEAYRCVRSRGVSFERVSQPGVRPPPGCPGRAVVVVVVIVAGG